MGREKNSWHKKGARFKKPKSRVNGLNDNLNNIKKINKKKRLTEQCINLSGLLNNLMSI